MIKQISELTVKQTHHTINPTNSQMLYQMITNTVIKVSHKTNIYLTDLATKISIAVAMTLPHQVLYTYLRETATQPLITEALSSCSLLKILLFIRAQPT
jgi:hypothetical protein